MEFQTYIHFRLNSYPLHIRELLSVFPGFRPNPVSPTIYIFHWLIYQIFKYISNIYPFQIKIHIYISFFYSRFINFRSNSYPFQIQYISISDPIHINYICMSYFVYLLFLIQILKFCRKKFSHKKVFAEEKKISPKKVFAEKEKFCQTFFAGKKYISNS